MAPAEDEEVNPYELLGLPIEATEGDIKSAYRKLSLKVHPDRHPNNPDAAHKFHELNQAYEKLLDPVKRLAIDAKTRQKEARKARFSTYDAKRKQMQEELEERERVFKKARQEQASEKQKQERENESIRDEGRRMREEREQRLEDEWRRERAAEKEQDQAAAKAAQTNPLDSTIKLKYPLAQYPSLTTSEALAAHLTRHRFGPLDEPIVVSIKAPKKNPGKPPKFATALVPFVTIGDAFALVCAAGIESRGLKDVEVTWAGGQEPSVVKDIKQATAAPPAPAQSAKGPKIFGSFGKSAAPAPTPGLDFESVTLMRLRQAERERLERELREQEAQDEANGS